MAKNNVRKQITEAGADLKEIMQEHLAVISENVIEQIRGKLERLTDSQRYNAIKDIEFTGQKEYESQLLMALSIIAYDALAIARNTVPKAKDAVPLKKEKKKQVTKVAKPKAPKDLGDLHIKLSEFDDLPADLQKKIKAQARLLVGSQMSDLEKNIFFQFDSSIDSTDSINQIIDDIYDSADDYIKGTAISSGSITAAGKIVNSARSAFFLDNDVLEEVDAFIFVNGDPVSDICTDLAGTVFAKDDPGLNRYMPPLHFNCKSSIEPILAGQLGNREIEKLKPSTQKIEDSIQFSDIENPRPGNLQTIIISKEVAKSVEEAKKIAKDFGAEHLDVDETETSYRFRQRNPSDFVEETFRTKPIEKAGVSLVYGQLK